MLSRQTQKNDFLIGLQACMNDSLFACNIDDLPYELRAYILEYLKGDPRSIVALSHVNQEWRILINNEYGHDVSNQLHEIDNTKFQSMHSSLQNKGMSIFYTAHVGLLLLTIGVGFIGGMYLATAGRPFNIPSDFHDIVLHFLVLALGGVFGTAVALFTSLFVIMPLICLVGAIVVSIESCIQRRHSLRSNFQFFSASLQDNLSEGEQDIDEENGLGEEENFTNIRMVELRSSPSNFRLFSLPQHDSSESESEDEIDEENALGEKEPLILAKRKK